MRKRRALVRGLSHTASAVLLAYCCVLVDLANLVSADGKFLKEDIFFEILEPESLRYTFRLRPAHEFGASFVSGRLFTVLHCQVYFLVRLGPNRAAFVNCVARTTGWKLCHTCD